MEHTEELNEIIQASLDGLPFPLVASRLVLAIVGLCEELENHGRDSRVILRDLMLRGEDETEGENHEPTPDLGSCCACGRFGLSVRNVIMLDKKAPQPGTGWGCVVCGLPQDGAVYVLCDAHRRRAAAVLGEAIPEPAHLSLLTVHEV